ncbi:MAG: MFS transporter [Actinobacteria bacterium]|nr:MFS transporter [Actinomycetota bacterium]
MTQFSISHNCNAAEVALLTVPRCDIVAEQKLAGGYYSLLHGPFDSYSRKVDVSVLPENRFIVTEIFNYKLGIPYFGFLFSLPVRRYLRNRPITNKQPFWASPERFDVAITTTMATLAIIVMFTGFLSNAPAETHTYAADEFAVDQMSQGVLGAFIRIGTLLAIAVSVIADRKGRKHVLTICIVLGLLSSVAAALSPNLLTFSICLIVMRTANASLGVAIIVLAMEELPSGCRSWGLSVLGMSAAIGAGMVVWVQPLAGIAIWGWRLIYLVPLLMTPLMIRAIRQLPESHRFLTNRNHLSLRPYTRRIMLLGLTYFLIGIFLSPIDWFRNEYLRDQHNFSAIKITIFVLATATPGGIGLYIAGRLADTRGRRAVITVASVLGLGCTVLFFNLSDLFLWPTALVAILFASGLLPAMGVYKAEFFPTAVRARAATITGAIGVIGGSCGILLTGWLRLKWGDFGSVIAVLWLGPLIATLLIWMFFKESSRIELEELNPEDLSPSA